MFDLLNEPIIGIRRGGELARVSLPCLLADLARGRVDAYTGLRAHQADPWHALTVQLAASVLARGGQAESVHVDIPGDEAFWRAGLLDLAEGEESAWHLVETDLSRPAFMQHPTEAVTVGRGRRRVPVGNLAAVTPDELDTISTQRSHGLKRARACAHDTEAWLFAIATRQTSSGYAGKHTYGVVRMNSGSGTRCFVSVNRSLHPSERFREDLIRVCALRKKVLADGHGFTSRGRVLTWLEPWTGVHQWFRKDLEPWFVESCVKFRLTRESDGSLVAIKASTESRQIGPKELDGGDVGDPWTPTLEADPKNLEKGRRALYVDEGGWSPHLVVQVLLRTGIEPSPLQSHADGEGDLLLSMSVLTRDRAQTKQFHRLVLPVPASVVPVLFGGSPQQGLADVAEALLKDATEVRSVMRSALHRLAGGGEPKIRVKADSRRDPFVEGPIGRLDRAWHQAFYEHLWRAAAEPTDAVRAAWRAHLFQRARAMLRECEAAAPHAACRTWRARARAESCLSPLTKAGWAGTTNPEPEKESHADISIVQP